MRLRRRSSRVPRANRVAAAAGIAAAAIALGACMHLPWMPDRSARAPELDGYGDVQLPITTRSAAARHWFDRGLAQAYAFNEVEAVRAFKAALAQDPDCAMCAWGVAYQLGPNINALERGDLGEAVRYVDHALRHADGVSERERELIQAMAVRYGHRSQARDTAALQAPVCGRRADDNRPDPLDVAYAERLRVLADRHPDDPDIVSLYAEAEMIATREDWWDAATGRPAGRMGEVASRLEAALARHPQHTGLNHYLIHAVDALPVAQRAAEAADRLGSLAPRSPHLLHMPAHTYVHLGRYADASRVNEQALAADQALGAALGAQGFSISKDWRGHNSHFLWYAALMQGRGELALETARGSAARAAAMDQPFAEIARSRPLLTLVRLEQWDAVLKEPLPGGSQGPAQVLGPYARGVALARTGRVSEASAALAQVESAAAALAAKRAGHDEPDTMLRAIAEMAREGLRAEVAAAQGRMDDALAAQARSEAAGKTLDEQEPPTLGAGARLALGDLQLKAGQWAAAEQTFRADLALHPHSGWALRGLARALRGEGRGAEASAMAKELRREWPQADADLLAMK